MEKEDFNILIVDDDEDIRVNLKLILESEGYTIFDAASGEESINILQSNDIGLVLLDLKMGGMSGEETLKQIKEINPETIVSIMTGHATLDSSLEAIKYGAYDYLKKPLPSEDLKRLVFKAYDRWKLSKLITHYNNELKHRYVKRNRELLSIITLSERIRNIDSLNEGAKLVVDTIHDAVEFDKVALFLVDGKGVPKVLSQSGFSVNEPKDLLEIYHKFQNNNKTHSSNTFFSPIFFEKEVLGALYVEKLDTKLEPEDETLITLISVEITSFLLKFRYNIVANVEKEAPSPIRYEIPKGNSFAVYEKMYDKSFEIFKDLVTHNISGLAITRTPQDSIKKSYGLEKTPFIWLSKVEGPNTISPLYLNSILNLIKDFTLKGKNSVVILEGTEYLISQNSFEIVLKFIQALKDLILIQKSRLLIPINKDALTQKEIILIEKELQVLK